jgi:hypothetical protein
MFGELRATAYHRTQAAQVTTIEVAIIAEVNFDAIIDDDTMPTPFTCFRLNRFFAIGIIVECYVTSRSLRAQPCALLQFPAR